MNNEENEKIEETFIERLERLLVQKNLQRKDLAQFCNISLNGISTWKITGTIPRADIAIKIAKFLNVSVEYLINGELQNIDTSDKLAFQVSCLSPEKREVIQTLIKALEVF